MSEQPSVVAIADPLRRLAAPDAVVALRGLRGAGLRVVTTGSPEHCRALLVERGLSDLVEAAYDDLGIDALLDECGVSADELAVVSPDDGPLTAVVGALLARGRA